ncbi:MAG: site-specific DNA-methyltransferase [Rhodospirillaceae bacterium]
MPRASQTSRIPRAKDQIVHRNITHIKPSKENPRTHSASQIHIIADSIQTFGFIVPILIDENGFIIAGHGRLAAAKLLGLKQVPTICVSDLTDSQKRAYIIADNRIAELAGWDMELLGAELEHLDDLELDFDLTVTGFDMAEIDMLVSPISGQASDQTLEEQVPPVEKTIISRPGDLWILGRHRLYVGDATQFSAYQKLMDGSLAKIVFTDPPYNVPIKGNVSGLGSKIHGEFMMASGEMSQDEFTTFLESVFYELVGWSTKGSIHYICMDWRHMQELMDAAHDIYSEVKNVCVWNKTNGGMGSFYRSKHEFVFVLKNGAKPHINNFKLGQKGRYRTNVWDYAGASSFGESRTEDLEMHPTVKPVQMICDALLDCSNRGDIVLDPFGGSGSTLIAAERVGRNARLMELDPKYADVIIRRWEAYTGDTATEEHTKESFRDRAEVCHDQ